MEKIVLDASVLVKWYSEEKDSDIAHELLFLLRDKKIEVFLPELAKYELGNALIKGKQLSYALVKEAVESFYALPLNFIKETKESAEESYRLAQQLKITYYDACYLAISKQLRATLITENPKHQKKKGLGIKICPLKKYA